MSEFNPFGASDQAPEHVTEEVTEESGSKRNVIALGALAAVAVGAGAFFLLGGSGGDEELEAFVPTATAPKAAAPAPTASPATLPVASKLTLGRNPFRALYVAPAAAPAGDTTTTPTGTTGGTTTPVVIVDGGPAPAPAPVQPAPAQPAPAKPAPAPAPAQSTVSLKSVAAAKDGSNPTATFVYDGKEVSGAPGDVMAGKLLVISIQQDAIGGWFANLQLGDGSPFEVHERQKVVVQ